MANVIRTVQSYAANTMYARAKEAAQTVGEEVIVLSMYHVGIDEGTQPRCTCYNGVYENSQQWECPLCFGTTFQDGVKEAWRVWAIINDNRNQDERLKQGGVYLEGHNQVQLEPWPPVMEQDYIVRVKEWNTNTNVPLTFGRRLMCGVSQNISVRTGNYYGNGNMSQIAQTVEVKLLPPNHIIYGFDILANVEFPRFDGEMR